MPEKNSSPSFGLIVGFLFLALVLFVLYIDPEKVVNGQSYIPRNP
jgi:hypothetical protein